MTFLPFSDAVYAGFGQEERFVASEILKARQICAQILLAVEIHVERRHIEKRQIEVFRRRVVDVCEQTVWRAGFGFSVDVTEKPLDTVSSLPSHDRGRDLIAKRDERDTRMRFQHAHLRNDIAPDAGAELLVIQERDVLGPGNADHETQAAG